MNPPEGATTVPGAAAAAQTAESASTKAIALFSDGTGNSSAKVFKTNVWRMYEAVDLGADAISPDQIVFYAEGVGNSGFRPLAILGGVFGWGLKRNVINLYSFLCRNYRDDDQIYAFGFSRGAFTIRVLIGLIASQGLVPYRNEADLAHQAHDAYRAYIRGHVPRFPPMRWLLPLWRLLIFCLLFVKRWVLRQHRYDRAANRFPDVRFVGLWDTVAAYGGPIIELVRAFGDWIRPLSFKDTVLPDNVIRARQALALDDERDAFQPVPWDEPLGVNRDRIKQVWFAGMHADVGGGYPDDSLAYVSLAWMMKEAADAGLELRDDKVEDANRIANAFGPIHDSRAGWGAYYRYQPRIVGAYVEPPEPGTESIEDPAFEDQGLNQRAWIHESVLHRINAGTDGYAPVVLPKEFRVVNHDPTDSSFPLPLRANLASTAENRADWQENIRDLVWVKRAFYFATVLASIALLAMPLWLDRAGERLCSDSRCVLGTVFGWLKWVLPGFAQPWIDTFSKGPGSTIVLLILIVIFMSCGKVAERGLRDRTRALLRQSLAGSVPQRTGGLPFIRWLRTGGAYQGMLGFVKWQALPFIFGLLMLLAILYAAFVALTQVWLVYAESGTAYCADGPSRFVARARLEFSTKATCVATGMKVKQGLTYEIAFQLPLAKGQPVLWKDRQFETTPQGLAPAGLHYLSMPLLRVMRANYLQPLAEIRRGDRATARWPNISALQLQPVQGRAGVYTTRFKAPATGALHLFANDAALPFGYGGFIYDNNEGTAEVTIVYLPERSVAASAKPAASQGRPGGGQGRPE